MSVFITDSQFYMWRTVFALSHADDVVTDEELRFMVETIESFPFSEAQKETLHNDAKDPQSPDDMFALITDPVDQVEFFKLASHISNIDGDFADEEQEVIARLKKKHLERVDITKMVDRIELSFEDDDGGGAPFSDSAFVDPVQSEPFPAQRLMNISSGKRDFKEGLRSYRERFMRGALGQDD